MTFKEAVLEDTKKVFLNFDEFGEMHVIDGRELLVIVDNNEHLEREKRSQNSNIEGLYRKQLLFYVLKEDFGSLPSIGRLLRFDKQDYKVIDAINEDGIYSITLEANRS